MLVRDKEVRVVGERANVRNPTDLSDKCVFRMLLTYSTEPEVGERLIFGARENFDVMSVNSSTNLLKCLNDCVLVQLMF